MIITFSGCDGSGKSTQIDLLYGHLNKSNKSVKKIWSRGGYTPGFTFFKKLFLWVLGKKGSHKKTLDQQNISYFERRKSLLRYRFVSRIWLFFAILDLFLFYCVYLRLLNIVFSVVLCDRFVHDTKIDFIRNFPSVFNEESWFWKILLYLCPEPKIRFVFTVPVALSQQRAMQKKEPFPDNASTLEFRLKCYTEWKEFNTANSVKINGTYSVGSIEKKIVNEIRKKL